MELLWSLYTNRSTWKTVYRPFGSIDFHASAGIPAFRVQRVKSGRYINVTRTEIVSCKINSISTHNHPFSVHLGKMAKTIREIGRKAERLAELLYQRKKHEVSEHSGRRT